MMDNVLFSLLKGHIREAKIGGILGFISSGTFLFTTGGNWYNLIGEWMVRGIFTVLIAIVSAIATAWAKDWYQKYKESRSLKKQKIDEQREKNKAA